MQYVNKTFTLPTNTTRISQKEWDRIFGKKKDQWEGLWKDADLIYVSKNSQSN